MDTRIDYIPCAGDGDYSVWFSHMASQCPPTTKHLSNYTKRQEQGNLIGCPSDSESLMPDIEHPTDDHLVDWDNIGCAEEVAQKLTEKKND